jgi:hypothetical protein
MDTNSILIIKTRTKCDKSCPAFSLCPLMPLSIGQNGRTKSCLVNEASEELRRAYIHLFVAGADGVIEQMQLGILEYGKILRDTKMTNRERLKYLKELNTMLQNLHKILAKGKSSGADGTKPPGEEEIVITTGHEEEREEKNPDIVPKEIADNPVLRQFFDEE